MAEKTPELRQIWNRNKTAFIFSFFTVDIWYYHAIYRVFKYFASFTGYKDDIFKVISNLYVQESKFGRYIYKLAGKNKLNPRSSKSD